MTFADRRRRRRRQRAQEALETELAGVEQMTPADLRVICLALEDRIGRFVGTPAGEAAARVRNKIERNMTR